MKIFDKIKNYFYDDSEEDGKKTSSNEISKNSDKMETKNVKNGSKTSNDDNNSISERELFKTDPTFNFPIVFDDDDFKEEKTIKKPFEPTREVFTKTTIQTVERKIFKPSPNISPIYGLIDDAKLSDKVTLGDNHISTYNKNKKMNIDDVLGKVHTRTTVEVEKYNTEDDPIIISSTSEDLTYDFFENKLDTSVKSRAELNKVSLDNTNVKLKTIDELLENTDEEDFYSLVDSMYKDNDEEGDL